MEKLLILDSNSLMNRAFYAVPDLTNSEGIHTNAVYGFTNMLLKMKEEFNPDYIVAAFDRKAPTFRHKEFSDYKAGRKKMPPELGEQFPIVKELLELLAINIYEIDGFEADDIIGTVAKIAEKHNIEVFVVTGDKDALQLASEKTNVVITKKGVTETAIYNKKIFMDEFGVTPTQFIDVKGLMGDKSDNIPGVPGVGEKTAFKLIQTYGSVEEVLNNIDSISGKKLKENLENNREQAIFSKKLATIMTEVPIEIDLDEIKSRDNYDKESLKKLLVRLGLKKLMTKLCNDSEEEKEDNIVVEVIDDIEKMKEVINLTEEISYISYSTLNSSVYSKIELEKRNSEIENEYRNKPERNIDIKKYYIYFGSPRFNFREFESLESLMEKAESTINKARNIMQSEEFSDFEKYISIGVNYTLSEGYQGSRDIVNNVSLDGIESNTFNWSRDVFTEKLVLDDESVKKLKDLIDILNS